MTTLQKLKEQKAEIEAQIQELELAESGVGIVIEKAFQPGRKKIEEAGFDIFSLARISKLAKNKIEFI